MKTSSTKKFRCIVGISDKIVSKDLTVMLSRLNYLVVQEATNTDDVIMKTSAEEVKPDIIVMQLGLQGSKDAVETAWDIYDRYNVPTLYIAAAADRNLFDKMAEKNYYGHVRKPYDQASISTALQKAIVKHLNEYLKRPV